MNPTEVFKDFVDGIVRAFPSRTFTPNLDLDKAVAEIEDQFYPNVLQIIRKDVTFFESSRTVFNINLSELFGISPLVNENLWSGIVSCMVVSLFHGDPKNKIGKVFDVVKNIWSSTDSTNAEIDSILNDDSTKGKFQEFYDIIKDTKLLKTILQLVKTLDFSDLNLESISNEKFLEYIQNPENPELKKIVEKMMAKVQTHIQKSKINPQDFQREIEMIKARAISLFGGMLNGMLGGQQAAVSSSVLMGTSPEARRQRMLARLQKKVRDKK